MANYVTNSFRSSHEDVRACAIFTLIYPSPARLPAPAKSADRVLHSIMQKAMGSWSNISWWIRGLVFSE
jgi:hypothetical protein